MNRTRLLEAEARFLGQYPAGFDDPGLASIKKKHNVDKLTEFARRELAREKFHRPVHVVDTALKIVSRSSMVSRFEKPKFRDFVQCLNSDEKAAFAQALELRLYGRARQRGFEELVGMLQPHGVAKWSVVSVIPFYVFPQREAFVKPTTAKGIIAALEVDDLQYRPQPTWAFYRGYQRLLKDIRDTVSDRLAPNNAALTGFLMTSL